MSKTMRHSRADIDRIVETYIDGIIERVTSEPTAESIRNGIEHTRKGSERLRKLELSEEDSRHISLLYGAFTNLRIALEALGEGRKYDFIQKVGKTVDLIKDYIRRVTE